MFCRFLISLICYCLSGAFLDHTESEKDLGVHVHERLSWSVQYSQILSKATQRFNLLRRTCHFVKNQRHKRALYLTMVRSIFEHGNSVWSPSSTTIINKFEAIQKRAVKWILGEQFYVYSNAYYTQKLIDLDILPMAEKFIFNDLVLFYKIINDIVPINLPQYIIFRSNTRSFSSCGNILGLDSEIVQHPIKNVFGRSFFPRCISLWNHLPADIKASETINIFITGVKSYLWDLVLSSFDNSDVSYELEPD